MKLLGRVKRTSRGFELMEFKDIYGTSCSLQQSSLADQQAVWLGVDDPQPKVIHHEAASVGVKTDATEGWVPYPIPEEVLLTTRMHLNRKLAVALVDRLSRWIGTGSFE